MAKQQKRKKLATKSHSWRLCPSGEHWVSEHQLTVPASKKNPDGKTSRGPFCRVNPSHKDQIYHDEISEIARKHFGRLKKLPDANRLGRKNGNDYDQLIAGWVKYWNEVLKPKDPLESNFVKALISSESDFDETAKILASPGNWARGLMQITDETIRILKDEKGEVGDHLININQNSAHDPNLNICAGVRWLFHKKSLLEHKLKRAATWEEAAMEYKAYTGPLKRNDKSAIKQREKLRTRYRKLKHEKS
jgi:hypothetical protein